MAEIKGDFMQKFMTIQTLDEFPFGRRPVNVAPLGEIETRASGLRYLRVKSVSGFPFPNGYGDSIFHNDMHFYNQDDFLVTDKLEAEYNRFMEAAQ